MPTSPFQSDLHVNAPLTNVSIAYIQSSDVYIADKIFPKVPVQKQTDVYWKYSKSDWRRSDAQLRAPGTESAGTEWKNTTDVYSAKVYALHHDIDDQTRANADSNFHLDSDATEFITNQMLLKRDIDWTTKYFQPGVWANNKVGTTDFTQWDAAGSDPIDNVTDWILQFRLLTGYTPNKMIMGAQVLKKLKQHPDILDRIKYTQKGIVTVDLLATLFEVPEIYVPYATKANTIEFPDAVTQDAAATYSFVSDSKSVLLCYAPKSPSLLTPSAGYTFTWNGYLGGNKEGIRVKRFRHELIEADRVEAAMTYDMKVVAADMGWFASAVVA
jgi:hypothetical protein